MQAQIAAVQAEIAAINEGKAVFDDIYNEADPRSYFSVLGSLNYMIPDVAEPIVRQIVAAKAALYGDVTVLDVGCSYGINAATHRFPVNFTSLLHRYARREMMSLPSDKLIELDRHFYASWPDIGSAQFIGLDISEAAIRYANETGVHANGIAADLESRDLSAAEAAIVAPANILLSTGSIGYVSNRTYEKLLRVVSDRTWAISFVLRMFPFDGFVSSFREHGLVTEKLTSATFIQRRFRDADEFEKCLSALAERGIDTHGFEAEGLFHADLFLSRPADDAKAMPIDEIVTISSGRYSSFGARFVQIEQPYGTQTVLEA